MVEPIEMTSGGETTESQSRITNGCDNFVDKHRIQVEHYVMSKNRKISVALCTYNGAEFISEQLESILNQTVSINEIVVCDDASTDRTWQLILSWQKKYPKIIRPIRYESNIGYIKNFEKAISLCTGDIIFLSDQDDVWYEYKVEKILEMFLSNPECEMVASDAEITDVKLKRSNTTLLRGRGDLTFNNKSSFHKKYDRSFFYGCTLAIRSSFLEFVLPIPKSWGHDNWIGFIATMTGNTKIVPETLMLYRNHVGGAGNNEKFKKFNVLKIYRNITSSSLDRYELDIDRWSDLYNHLLILRKKNNIQISDEFMMKVGSRRDIAICRFDRMKDPHVVDILKLIKLLINGSYSEYLNGWRSFVKDMMNMVLIGGTRRKIG